MMDRSELRRDRGDGVRWLLSAAVEEGARGWAHGRQAVAGLQRDWRQVGLEEDLPLTVQDLDPRGVLELRWAAGDRLRGPHGHEPVLRENSERLFGKPPAVRPENSIALRQRELPLAQNRRNRAAEAAPGSRANW